MPSGENKAKIGPALTAPSARLIPEDEPVILIQVFAALLLLLGSGLIIQALVALERPSRPRALARRRCDQRLTAEAPERTLPRAA